MRKLTNYQKQFLLDFFFVNDKEKNWKDIARLLLKDGYAIVAGKECIWTGAIGNYIKVSKPDNSVGCLKYNFDLESLLKSKWYQKVRYNYFIELCKEEVEIKQEARDIDNLI